mgnify:CR=1 FL=1
MKLISSESVFILCSTLLIILFFDEPDLMDALITWITTESKK